MIDLPVCYSCTDWRIDAGIWSVLINWTDELTEVIKLQLIMPVFDLSLSLIEELMPAVRCRYLICLWFKIWCWLCQLIETVFDLSLSLIENLMPADQCRYLICLCLWLKICCRLCQLIELSHTLFKAWCLWSKCSWNRLDGLMNSL